MIITKLSENVSLRRHRGELRDGGRLGQADPSALGGRLRFRLQRVSDGRREDRLDRGEKRRRTVGHVRVRPRRHLVHEIGQSEWITPTRPVERTLDRRVLVFFFFFLSNLSACASKTLNQEKKKFKSKFPYVDHVFL